MKPQFDNQVMSSLLLWFDNKLLTKGEAFQNTTGQFYSVSDEYYGYETYASTYSQIVSDFSVPGASIPTGLYAGGTFAEVGSNNLHGIDYNNGRSYWSAAQSSDVTGSFSIKDFNVFLTNSTEDEILFQTQYTNRNEISTVVPTGLEPGTKTYPVVYLKNDGSFNEPFAFGGQDNTVMKVRAIVIADRQFDIDAIGSLFRDQEKTLVPIFEEADMPFNQFGFYKDFNPATPETALATVYNYTGVTAGKTESQQFFLEDVNISRFDRVLENEVRKFNPNVFSTLIDFEINKIRFPRL
jgi:hypothetical protein|tara:strand:+ start:142 stop:1029 length:888 start_codon:yes stop_codon:yes gene_type:complete